MAGCFRSLLKDSVGTYLIVNDQPLTYDDGKLIFPMDGLTIYNKMEATGSSYIGNQYLWTGGSPAFLLNAGKEGKGASFPGTWSSSLYDTSFDYPEEDFYSGSMSFWVKVTEGPIGSYDPFILDWDDCIRVFIDHDFPTMLKVDWKTDNDTEVMYLDVNITDGDYHHIVIRWDSSVSSIGSVDVWVDGVQEGSGASPTGLFRCEDKAFCIGDVWKTSANLPQGVWAGTAPYHWGFVGDFDELGIWSEILSDCEISTLYNQGVGWFIDDVWIPPTQR